MLSLAHKSLPMPLLVLLFQQHHLSPRQAELVALEVWMRPTRKEVAMQLCLAPDSVTEYRRHIYQKLGLSSWAEVFPWAHQQVQALLTYGNPEHDVRYERIAS